MKEYGSLLALALVSFQGLAQEARLGQPVSIPQATVHCDTSDTRPCLFNCAGGSRCDRMAGNHNFDNFIGFVSNPLFNIDPRAVTALYPMFGKAWFSTSDALPHGDFWMPPAAGLTVALSERLSMGLNQGGYLLAHFEREPRDGPLLSRFRDRFGRLRDRREFEGDPDGWLNLGGFVQYTLIEDVPGQFLATAGLRVIAPSGSEAIFQGQGPWDLAPYVTVGKEFGDFHVLANLGYQFPAGSGSDLRFFYGSVHLDRRFGCLYPLVEFNWIHHSASAEIDLPIRGGFLNFGNFESSGNLVSMAVGANAVLIPNKLEVGAVYSTSLATQRDFEFDGFLLKMVLRY